ncbi:MAG: hypothetical protein JNL49_11215 [Bacteroidia bacterium]|nr:hypothetical protein [Bacteroidia bacterium]
MQSASAQSSFGKFILARNLTAPVTPTCTGTVTIVQPFAYYSFDVSGQPEESSNPTSPNTAGSANPLTGGMVVAGNLKGRGSNNALTTDNLSVAAATIIGAQNNVPLTDYFAIEFIFRLSKDFINQKTGELFKVGGQNGYIEYPTTGSNIIPFIKFETTGTVSGSTLTHDLIVELSGIGRKSISYYLDNEYHHFCFIYNATTGDKEIWVDGELNSGFSENITNGAVINQGGGGNQLWLWSGGNTSKFRGDLDEIAIYDEELCEQQIVEHFIDAITNEDNYDYNGPFSATTSSNNLNGTLTQDDYVDGYNLSTNSYTSSPVVMDQLTTFPLAKFKPGHTFRRNTSWMQMQYVGGLWNGDDTQTGFDNSIAIQKELTLFWNYYFNVVENMAVVTDLGAPSTGEAKYTAAWVDFANQNYKDSRFKFALKTYRAQMHPDEVGYPISVPYIDYLGHSNPLLNYLNDDDPTTVTYFDRTGGTHSTPKYWSPRAPLSTYQDGEVQRDYFNDFLFTHLTTEIKIDYVAENNEIITPFNFIAGVPVAPNLDPNVVDDKNNNFSTLNWEQYLGLKKSEIDLDYSDVFMNGSVGPIEDALYLNYGVDGFVGFGNFTYEYMRNTQKEIDGMRYSTPSLYAEGPQFWFQTQSTKHGIDWLQKSRNNEFLVSSGVDQRFAPFVSPGWNLNETENMRPAQYLGFLKSVGMFGVDFYHPGFFNIGSTNADPKGYIWQVSTPSYAQAVFTRSEEFFTNGSLQFGDIDIDRLNPGVSGMGYMFNTGDYSDLVNARKVNSLEKFLISGAPMPCSNVGGNVSDQKTVTINIDPISSNLTNITFDIRRQGSVYSVDATNPSDMIVTQLDKWHQASHPYFWTKDFFFEAEMYDNSPSAVIKTRKPNSNNALTGGDFSDFDTYLDYSGGTYSTEYRFTPRDNSSLSIINDYVLYIRAREVTGTGANKSIKVELRSSDNSQTFVTRLSCINNSSPSSNLDFTWYKVCGSSSTFENLKPDMEYILTLIPENTDLQIDQIYLESPDPEDPFPILASDLSTATDCDNVTLSINSTSAPCTGPLSTATVTAEITNCSGSGTYDFNWSNGATTTGAISSVITGADPLQIYTVTVTAGGMSSLTASSSPISTTSYDFINPEISTNTVWDNTINGTNTIKIQGVIQVQDGATLTIDDGMQIEFSYGISPDEVCDLGKLKSGIIVEIGAKLDIQPNTILTGCNDGIWEGIEVVGDLNESQSPTTLQGFVDINGTSGNEVEIRYANMGILGVKAPGVICDYKFGGGIINANYCNFIDNYVGVKLVNYPGSESYFENCKFEVSNNYPFSSYANQYGPVMVELNNHQGTKFMDCTFNRSDFSSIDEDERGIGIQAYNSAFSLQDLSGFGSGDNIFSNLTQGVSVYQYLGAVLQNTIEGNTFDNVMQGIYLQGVGTDLIHNNDFINMPLPAAGLQTYGIYVIDGTGFEVSENEFTASSSGSSDQYALGFENCDGAVFKNYILESSGGAKFDIGLQTEDDNSHLKIGCNEFGEPGIHSIAVASGSLRQQGFACNTDGEPAGNLWMYNASPGCSGEQNIYVEASVPTFDYYKYAKDVSSDPNTPDPSCHTSGKVNFPLCGLDQTSSSCNFVFPGLNIQPPPASEYEEYKDAILTLISTYADSASVDSVNMNYYLSEIWLLELELVKWQKKYEDLESVVQFLYSSTTFAAKKQLAQVYLYLQMTDSLASVLDEIDRDADTLRSIENNNFIAVLTTIHEALDENGILDSSALNQVVLNESIELVTRTSSKAEVVLNTVGLANLRHTLSIIGGGARQGNPKASISYKNSEFLLYPNPGNEKVTVSYNIQGDCEKSTLLIYDKMGNEIAMHVLYGKSGTFEISTVSFAPAIYSCKFINCEEESLKKLVIIR